MRLIYGLNGEEATLRRFLALARATALAVGVIMVVFGIEPPFGTAPVFVVLAVFVLYNVAAGAYAFSAWHRGAGRVFAVVLADLIVTSLVVGITGAYNSPYFAMFLFTMAETALFFGWRIGTAVIVSMNGLQLVATAIAMVALRKPGLFSPIDSRFLLLLVVGILFVVLSETMRRQERARRTADRVSAQVANLNAIYAQMGQAHLHLEKVFDTVFSAAESLEALVFCAILRRSQEQAQWKVVATSRSQVCPVGEAVSNTTIDIGEVDPTSRPRVVNGAAVEAIFPCVRGVNCRQLLVCNMPFYSEREEGMLVVGRSDCRPLDANEETFLQSLAMQAQLAIHNALLYRERDRQLARLKEFKRAQDAFFAAAAHELKTPLTVLGVLASTLAMTIRRPSPQQREMLTTIEQNIRRLQAHTQNMLAAARIETEEVVVKPRRINPKRVAHRVIDAMKMMFTDRQLEVDLQPKSPWPAVTVDPDRLSEVYSNLLSNAAKFAPSNSRITVSCRPDGRDLHFTVCDSGPGIAPAERERIFEKAYTGKEAGSRAGTGLGLYIVKELVRLHGGKVWIDSASRPTCFHFSLPLRGREENTDDDERSDEDTRD